LIKLYKGAIKRIDIRFDKREGLYSRIDFTLEDANASFIPRFIEVKGEQFTVDVIDFIMRQSGTYSILDIEGTRIDIEWDTINEKIVGIGTIHKVTASHGWIDI
jgi:hypothetical protein